MNHKQLIFAREYRGYSQTELAKKVKGLSQSNLSKFEKGISVLSDEIINRLVEVLDFPKTFLDKKINIECDNVNYRKKTTITKCQRLEFETSYKFYGYLIDQLLDSVELPNLNIKPVDLSDGFTPESAAVFTRKYLKIPRGEPVRDIFNILEKNGIIVAEYDADEKFDGVSFLTDNGVPAIIINRNFDNDRKRFTLAHELGHIVLHVTGDFPIPDFRNKEDEANRFASEFLMPELEIKNSLRNLKFSELIRLKGYWLCSMASIIRRAWSTNAIDKKRYQMLSIELSRKGYRKKEPGNVYIDSPKLFKLSYQMHKDDLSYSDKELAEAFCVPIDVIDKFFSFNKNNGKLKIVI